MNQNFKEVAMKVGFHGKILLRGFTKVLYGSAVSGLIALAIYGFAAIPTEGGYIAVCEFIVAVATLVVAIGCMYAFGGKRKKKGRYAANG